MKDRLFELWVDPGEGHGGYSMSGTFEEVVEAIKEELIVSEVVKFRLEPVRDEEDHIGGDEEKEAVEGTPVDPDDDLMTIEHWEEMVRDGSLIDYDGFGELSDGKFKSGLIVSPRNFGSEEYAKKKQGWTHVVWYNR